MIRSQVITEVIFTGEWIVEPLATRIVTEEPLNSLWVVLPPIMSPEVRGTFESWRVASGIQADEQRFRMLSGGRDRRRCPAPWWLDS